MGKITCPHSAQRNKTITLKCELNQHPHIGIIWVRPDGLTVVKCKAMKCTNQPCCTNNYSTKDIGYQKSTLIIRKFIDGIDDGVWHCNDGDSGHREYCNIIIAGKISFTALMSLYSRWGVF